MEKQTRLLKADKEILLQEAVKAVMSTPAVSTKYNHRKKTNEVIDFDYNYRVARENYYKTRTNIHKLVSDIVEEKYPTKDMNVLKKYDCTHNDKCIWFKDTSSDNGIEFEYKTQPSQKIFEVLEYDTLLSANVDVDYRGKYNTPSEYGIKRYTYSTYTEHRQKVEKLHGEWLEKDGTNEWSFVRPNRGCYGQRIAVNKKTLDSIMEIKVLFDKASLALQQRKEAQKKRLEAYTSLIKFAKTQEQIKKVWTDAPLHLIGGTGTSLVCLSDDAVSLIQNDAKVRSAVNNATAKAKLAVVMGGSSARVSVN